MSLKLGTYVKSTTTENWTLSSSDDERVHLHEEALDLRADRTWAERSGSATGAESVALRTQACERAAEAPSSGLYLLIGGVLVLHSAHRHRLYRQDLSNYQLARAAGGEAHEEGGCQPLHRCLARALRPAEAEACAAEAARLLAEGADATSRTAHGLTPLHLATAAALRSASPAVDALVGSLLERGADPNALDPKGCVPLHYLFPYPALPKLELAGLLLSKGARVDLAAASGETPLTLCVERAFPPREDTRPFARILGLLFGFAERVHAGALVDAWRTGLLRESTDAPALTERLLAKGAELPSGEVFVAIESALPEVAALLTARGACGPPRPAMGVTVELADGAATLRWECDEAPRTEGVWRVERKEHRDASWERVTELPDDAREVVDSSPPASERLRYRVRHLHQGGESGWARP